MKTEAVFAVGVSEGDSADDDLIVRDLQVLLQYRVEVDEGGLCAGVQPRVPGAEHECLQKQSGVDERTGEWMPAHSENQADRGGPQPSWGTFAYRSSVLPETMVVVGGPVPSSPQTSALRGVLERVS